MTLNWDKQFMTRVILQYPIPSSQDGKLDDIQLTTNILIF